MAFPTSPQPSAVRILLPQTYENPSHYSASLLSHTVHAADTRVLIVVGPSNHPPGSNQASAGGRVLKHCIENMTNLPSIKADLIPQSR